MLLPGSLRTNHETMAAEDMKNLQDVGRKNNINVITGGESDDESDDESGDKPL